MEKPFLGPKTSTFRKTVSLRTSTLEIVSKSTASFVFAPVYETKSYIQKLFESHTNMETPHPRNTICSKEQNTYSRSSTQWQNCPTYRLFKPFRFVHGTPPLIQFNATFFEFERVPEFRENLSIMSI